MNPILHHTFPAALIPRSHPAKLPGVQPLDLRDWLIRDEVFTQQMQERTRLWTAHRAEVFQQDPAALAPACELLDLILQQLSKDAQYNVSADQITRPDGVIVPINMARPLETAGQLVQEDLCILEKRGAEHVLTAAFLCFPASWRLEEKFQRPLSAIHSPVAPYDADMGNRVQRLFDLMRAEQPLWRSNLLFYKDPSLFAPRSETSPRPTVTGENIYVRAERQSLVKLPKTQAVVFSIHTYLARFADLPEKDREALNPAIRSEPQVRDQ